jgi:hypothetical protein
LHIADDRERRYRVRVSAQLEAELAALRDQLASLVAAHEGLRAQVDNARITESPTMRARNRCPACQTTRIAYAQKVLDRGESDARNALALCRPSFWSSKVVGELSACACTGCGLVEWYVKDPKSLVEVEDNITIVDGATAPTAPYR